MFLKIFKYDFLYVIKKISLLYITILLLSLISGLLIHYKKEVSYFILPTVIYGFLVEVVIIASMVLCMKRYYTTMISDEGYLTHTLPVKKSTLLLSKIFTYFIIQLISLIVIIISVLFVTLCDKTIIQIIYEFLKLSFSYKEAIPVIILGIVIAILLSIYEISKLAMCFSIGGMSNKNKLLFSFVAFIVLNYASGIIVEIFFTSMFFAVLKNSYDVISVQMQLIIVESVFIVLELIGILLCYFINLFILKRKLNLN